MGDFISAIVIEVDEMARRSRVTEPGAFIAGWSDVVVGDALPGAIVRLCGLVRRGGIRSGR